MNFGQEVAALTLAILLAEEVGKMSREKWMHLLVGYLVGSFFGITDVLGMLKGAGRKAA